MNIISPAPSARAPREQSGFPHAGSPSTPPSQPGDTVTVALLNEMVAHLQGQFTELQKKHEGQLADVHSSHAKLLAKHDGLRADFEALLRASGGSPVAALAPGSAPAAPASAAARAATLTASSEKPLPAIEPAGTAVHAEIEVPMLRPPDASWVCKHHRAGSHNVFVSYRVAVDRLSAQLLTFAIEREKRQTDELVTVFWDAQVRSETVVAEPSNATYCLPRVPNALSQNY